MAISENLEFFFREKEDKTGFIIYAVTGHEEEKIGEEETIEKVISFARGYQSAKLKNSKLPINASIFLTA